MSKCKYYKQQKYVSYDGGFTWSALEVYRKGSILVYDSPDCTPTPPTPTGYTDEYLTFVAQDDCAFKFSKEINYSLDSGETWNTLGSDTYTSILSSGDTIMWKNTVSNTSAGTFSSIGSFYVEGNPMSLLYGDDFIGESSLNGCTFRDLFAGNSGLTSAENLVLVAPILSQGCYSYMFYDCGLTVAPTLSAMTLAPLCYSYMFGGTNLTTAPELPATTLKNYCYENMFEYCPNLTTAPELPATTLANNCYQYMFQYCTSLATAPTLSATTLTNYCYYRMFNGCESLNNVTCLATDISATQCTYGWLDWVASNGTFTKYPNMNSWSRGGSGIPNNWNVEDFVIQYRTTSGTPYCIGYDKYVVVYSQVSYDSGSTWQTTSSAQTLVEANSEDCGYIPPQYRTTSGTPYCSGSTGYDKYVDVYSQVSYDSGSTWETTATTPTLVEAHSEDCGYVPQTGYTEQYLTFVAQESGTFTFLGMYNTDVIHYSLDSGTTWNVLQSESPTPTISANSKVMWKNDVTGGFSSTCHFYVEGNVMSLLYGDDFIGQTSLADNDWAFGGMFYGCTGLTSAENMVLPATTLSEGCYGYMFHECTSLTTAPELPATTLASSCYEEMFYGCSSLNNIKCLATNISAADCTKAWVNGVAANGTFTKAASADWSVKTGNNGIPSGWAVTDAT